MSEYDSIAFLYDSYVASFELEPWFLYLKTISGFYNVAEGKSVLDLGCGTGRLALMFLKEKAKLTAVDISAEMLSVFDMRSFELNLKPELILSDMAAFRRREAFDFIYSACDSVNCLRSESLPELFSCVKESLKPGGRFTFDVINPKLIKKNLYECYDLAQDSKMEIKRSVSGRLLVSDICFKQEKDCIRQRLVQELFSCDELTASGKKCGLIPEGIYDFLSFEPAGEESEKLQLVFKKTE